jgi:hypothetical protein
MNEMYKLKLNQGTFVDDGVYVLRVPGGWIYGIGNNNIFVPYNEEFSDCRMETGEEGELLTHASGISEALQKIKDAIFSIASTQQDLENLINEQSELTS